MPGTKTSLFSPTVSERGRIFLSLTTGFLKPFQQCRYFGGRHDIEHNDFHPNDIQHNDIQKNDFEHNDIQHNDIQKNDIEHNGIRRMAFAE